MRIEEWVGVDIGRASVAPVSQSSHGLLGRGGIGGPDLDCLTDAHQLERTRRTVWADLLAATDQKVAGSNPAERALVRAPVENLPQGL
ncbi:hypothetical protein GCM10027184_64280 [Saccharothrix stipae]